MYSVKVIEDSISPSNKRVTTLELRYPRWIHSELMTHRVFSRSAASSRAIPVNKILKNVLKEKVEPIRWESNKPGMQSTDELGPFKKVLARGIWNLARLMAVSSSYLLSKIGLHKQWTNRIVEPFTNISVIVTATEWDNFFTLRNHKDSQPEIKHLAELMKAAIEDSVPRKLGKGQWHLPYVLEDERKELSIENQIKISVARSARVSYLLHDNSKPSLEKDFGLFERLVGSKPIHASPSEHQATPIESLQNGKKCVANLKGFVQARWFIEHDKFQEIEKLTNKK